MTDYQTEAQAAEAERVRQGHRRGPWQLFEQRKAAKEAEDARRQAFIEAGRPGREALAAATRFAPEPDLSRDERTELIRQAGESETDRRRRVQAVMQGAANEATGSRNLMQSALDSGDYETYVAAFSRLQGLDRFVRELTDAENTRREIAARPFFAQTARA